jgi:SAM-dependent methyltransferase
MKKYPVEHPLVLDVGCGTGSYAFLWEMSGARVIAFDYNPVLIDKANTFKKDQGSSVEFIVLDGNNITDYFKDVQFDFIFMSGFSLFKRLNDKEIELMKKYLKLLKASGKLIFINNTNLTGTYRPSGWINLRWDDLNDFFKSLDCYIDQMYFYDRHILGRIFYPLFFNSVSTAFHMTISKVTRLPCELVLVVSKNNIENHNS